MTRNDDNQESGLSFRKEPEDHEISFKEESSTSGLSFKEEPATSGLSFKEEPATSGLSFKEEPATSRLSFKEEPATSGLSFKEEPANNEESLKDTSTVSTFSAQEEAAASTLGTDIPAAYSPEFDDPYVATATTASMSDITFKEFYKDYCSTTTKKNINGAAILLYVCSGITLIVSIFAIFLNIDIMAAALDAFVMLGLALGIHIAKSRVCAIIVLIYSLINCIITRVETGRLGGWLIILAGVYATVYTFKAHKEYNEFIGK